MWQNSLNIGRRACSKFHPCKSPLILSEIKWLKKKSCAIKETKAYKSLLKLILALAMAWNILFYNNIDYKISLLSFDWHHNIIINVYLANQIHV